MEMTDPLKTKLSPKNRAFRALMAVALALGLGLFAGSAAQAGPMASGLAGPDLTHPSLAVDVGYRRYSKNRWVYADQYSPDTTNSARSVVPYWAQSDEIRELRRLFPSTNWPPSDRY
jgi:hypothetical protein